MSKDVTIQIRISDRMKRRWQQAADDAGVSLSEWIRIRCEGMVISTAQPPAQERKAS